MNVGAIGGVDRTVNQSKYLQANGNTDFAEKLSQATQNISDTEDQTKLKQACRDMEAVFLNFMMSKMRDTVPKDGLIKQSNAESIMTSMLDGELTKNMAQAGGIGLADMLYHQLSQTINTAKNKSQTP